MPILKNVLGLDLGSHSLKAVEIQQSLRTLEAVHVRAAKRSENHPLPEVIARFVEVHNLSTDHVVTALRGLMGGTAEAEDVLLVLGEAVVLTAVFAPLTVRRYRRAG